MISIKKLQRKLARKNGEHETWTIRSLDQKTTFAKSPPQLSKHSQDFDLEYPGTLTTYHDDPPSYESINKPSKQSKPKWLSKLLPILNRNDNNGQPQQVALKKSEQQTSQLQLCLQFIFLMMSDKKLFKRSITVLILLSLLTIITIHYIIQLLLNIIGVVEAVNKGFFWRFAGNVFSGGIVNLLRVFI